MTLFGVQLTGNELAVIVLDVSLASLLEQLVARIHLHAEALQGADDFRCVSNDGVVELFRQRGKEVLIDGPVDAELHHLRVYEDDFQLCGVLLI